MLITLAIRAALVIILLTAMSQVDQMSNYYQLITDSLIFFWAYGFLSTTDLLQLICILELRNPSWRKFRFNVRRIIHDFVAASNPFPLFYSMFPLFSPHSLGSCFSTLPPRKHFSLQMTDKNICTYFLRRDIARVRDCWLSFLNYHPTWFVFSFHLVFSFVNDKGDKAGKNLSSNWMLIVSKNMFE